MTHPPAFSPAGPLRRPYRLQEITIRLRRSEGPTIRAHSPDQVAAAFRHLQDEPRESLYGLYLSASNDVIAYERVSTGSLTHTSADPAEVARTALLVTRDPDGA